MERILYLAGLLTLAACGHDGTENTAAAATDPAANATSSSQSPVPTSDDWHACDSLFQVMGGVQGKTVADLFVGDGYYTLKMLEAGARVIASDDDPRNVEALKAKKEEMHIGDDRFIIRNATAGLPNLSIAEVDLALCTKPYLSIPDRVNFFKKVKACIKPPCQLFIVDFLPVQSPVGPPMETRVTEEQVMDDMEPCGFTDIGGYSKKLPYRYVVQAMDFVEGPDGPITPAGPGSGQ